jgi:Ran GTPase-activating protein (RanGAP) involved in mRNA processing and transport
MINKKSWLYFAILFSTSVFSANFDDDNILQDRACPEEIISFLQKIPKEIYLLKIRLDENQSLELAAVLQANTSLTKITCDEFKNNLEGKAGFYLADAISKITTLKTLRLFNDKMSAQFATGLKNCKFITTFDISMYQLSQQQADCVAYAIKNNPNLKTLILKKNTIKGIGGKSIIDALEHHQTLSNITLDNNRVDNISLDIIFSVLSTLSSLKCIDFEQDYFDDDQIELLAKGLDDGQPITRIALGNCKIESCDGIIALARSLENNLVLTTLQIKDTEMSALAVNAIVNALVKNTALKNLSFVGCFFKNVNLVELLQAITKKNSTLKSLSLACCGIQISLALELVDALKYNSTITTFDLKGNNYSAMGSDLIQVHAIEKDIELVTERNKLIENLKANLTPRKNLMEIAYCNDYAHLLPWEIIILLFKNIIMIEPLNQPST